MAVCKLILELMTWNKEQQQGKFRGVGEKHVSKVLELYKHY